MYRDIVLTKRHFDEGLSAEDFTDTVNFQVSTCRLSSLPYWNELKSGTPLTPEQEQTRREAVEKRVLQSMPEADLSKIDRANCTNQPFPFVSKLAVTHNIIPTAEQLQLRLRCLLYNNIADSYTRISVDSGEPFFVSMPGVWNEDVEVTGIIRFTTAVVFQLDVNESMTSNWARRIHVHDSRISHQNLKDDGGFNVINDLHEMAHLQQILLNSDSVVPPYYEELDADYAAERILSESKRCPFTLEADRHCRHLGLLVSSPRYWFAPAMEEILNHRHPPNFYEVNRTVREIRTRMVMEAKGENHARYSSAHMQRAIGAQHQHPGFSPTDMPDNNPAMDMEYDFNDWLRCQYFHEPEVPLSLLKNLVDGGVFTEPLVRRTAQRIVEAAEFFNPDLTHEHRPETRVKFPSWMQRTSFVPEAKIA